MVNRGVAILCTMVLAASLAQRTDAHSWYPIDCCSDNDCMPADAIFADGRGGKTIVVGQTQIPIPAGTKPRPSPDERVHVCFRAWSGDLQGLPTYSLICLFVPADA